MVPSKFFEDAQALPADADGSLRLDAYPDGRTRVVLMLTRNQRCSGLWVMGPRTSASFKRSHGMTAAHVATIKPGWAAEVLDVPVTALTNQTVRLDALWGEAAQALTCAVWRDPASLLERLTTTAFTRTRAHRESSSARLARHAARLLEAQDTPVDALAQQLGVTARHLRRTFTEHVGVGPKAFARGARLQRALSLSQTRRDWGQVASAAGYFDQAHFSGEFKALMGVPPSRFEHRATIDASCAP